MEAQPRAPLATMRDLIAEIPYLVALSTYLSWTMLFLIGHVRDLFAKLFWGGTHPQAKPLPGYAELRQDYEDFYTRRAYYRVSSCFNRPVCSAPDRTMAVVMRTETPGMQHEQKPTGETRTVINLGSYNYLGFASSVRPPPHSFLACMALRLCTGLARSKRRASSPPSHRSTAPKKEYMCLVALHNVLPPRVRCCVARAPDMLAPGARPRGVRERVWPVRWCSNPQKCVCCTC